MLDELYEAISYFLYFGLFYVTIILVSLENLKIGGIWTLGVLSLKKCEIQGLHFFILVTFKESK